MARIILEHEDVGAWKAINSTFLTTQYYELSRDGDGAVSSRMGGDGAFSTDTVPGKEYNDDRRRGLLFQLGTFEEDADLHHAAAAGGAADHKGSHTDFDSIEIHPAAGSPVTLKRGDFFWLNVLDRKLGRFPMNAFHALYFWPVMYFRGKNYGEWRRSAPNNDPKYARAFEDKRLHPRLRLDPEVVRPNGKKGPHGALLTYWNGGDPWTITAEHHTDPKWGAPWYMRYTLETGPSFDVDVYDPVPRIQNPDPERPPTEKEVLDLMRRPAKTHADVTEIRIKATPWPGAWSHGGIHDDPWTKP
jgi:hypothetical protein